MARAKVVRLDLPAGRRVLVISDIHGNLPLLKGLLDKVGFSKDDILLNLGDMLERSLGGLETLRYMMELHREYTVYSVLGNCENVLLSFTDRGETLPPELYGSFIRKWGRKWTAVQMAEELGLELGSPREKPEVWAAIRAGFQPELDFLRSLPHILVNEDYIFVHGGVPREDRLEELDAYGCMKNDDFRSQGHTFRRWVIVGHWPVTLYRGDIQSAAPILDYDSHIASIDGGCTLKLDGQLNALILPEHPGGPFTWEAYDGFPVMTALDGQAPASDPLNIRWGRSRVEVLERGPEFSRCRHLETGREMDILTDYLREGPEGTWCEDSTDDLLGVKAGDKLAVERQTSRGALCKKDGVTGWYLGRLTE